MMRYTSLITLFLMSVIGAFAAGEGWLTDIEKARAQAKAEKKVMLLEFHGSDWCPPCIKLNKSVLSTDKFKSFASENLVLVDLDFPRRTKLSEALAEQNQKLASQYGVQYFPTVVLVSPDGKVLGQTVGVPDGGVDGFIEFIRKHTEG